MGKRGLKFPALPAGQSLAIRPDDLSDVRAAAASKSHERRKEWREHALLRSAQIIALRFLRHPRHFDDGVASYAAYRGGLVEIRSKLKSQDKNELHRTVARWVNLQLSKSSWLPDPPPQIKRGRKSKAPATTGKPGRAQRRGYTEDRAVDAQRWRDERIRKDKIAGGQTYHIKDDTVRSLLEEQAPLLEQMIADALSILTSNAPSPLPADEDIERAAAEIDKILRS